MFDRKTRSTCARRTPRRAGIRTGYGAVAVLVGLGVCLAASRAHASNPSGSRLAPHLLSSYTSGCQQMIQAHPRVIKIVGTGSAMRNAMREYKAGTPGGLVVLRVYTTKRYTVSDDPAWAAGDFWSTVLAPPIDALSEADRALIDFVEGPNESDGTPTWHSVQEAQWFNTFWVNLAPLIANAGFRPCAFSIGVGNPPGDTAYVNQMLDTIVPALRVCKQHNGAWSYHSYTLPYSTDIGAEIWYSLRYRQYYSYFALHYPDLVTLPLILTEGGVDGQSASGGPGWKAYDAARYQDWLAWFDARMIEDPYVVGCTLFQSGDFGNWFSFELDPIAPWLANHLASTNVPGPLISVSPTALAPSSVQGSPAPVQSFSVRNLGTGFLNYTISASAGWVSVNPAAGTATTETDNIVASFPSEALAPGTHTCTITVASADAANSPQTLNVTLTVYAHSDMDSDGDVDLSDFGLFQTCFAGPNRSYLFPGCAVADVDRDGDLDLSDFAAFLACFNGPNRAPACGS